MMTAPVITASHKRVPRFRLFRPTQIEEVCELLRQWPDAAFHAGGIDLVSRMKNGIGPSAVIALQNVGALNGVRRVGDSIEIGAATSHWQIEHDSLLRSCVACIPEYVSGLGNVRIRAQGTIGGNVMADEPGYEMLPLLAALDAELRFVDATDREERTAPARAWRPAANNGLLTAIAVPVRLRTLAWNREQRPAFGLVASLDWDGEMVRAGFGAVTGQRTTWRPLALDGAISRMEMQAQAPSLAQHWAARLPDIDLPGGPNARYCRHVASVWFRRALLQMTQSRP